MKNIHFEELPVSELFTAKYNRKVNGPVAKRWAKNFNMRLVGTIIVSFRDDRHYIVDGQHRVQAAKIKGVKMLPCIVHEGLTYEEEAALFVELQKERRGLTVCEVFNGECESQNTHALELKEAIGAAGYEYGNGTGRYRVQAIQVLKKIHAADGPETVTEVLNVIKDAWSGTHEANVRLILLGVWRFLTVYKYEHGRERLIMVLRKTPPADIIRGARGDLSGKSDATKSAMVILNLYNKGLTKKLVNRFE